MAGYATGEVFFVSQALGLRHSHLDSGGYSFDQKEKGKDPAKAVDFLIQDERARVFLTSMVSCLFAREVYKEPVLADCLNAVGYRNLAESIDAVSRKVQKIRWQVRMKTGFDPGAVKIPERFKQVVTWKGPLDTNYLESLRKAYTQRIQEMAKPEEGASP
jgi:aldehyde:ferredoxin oxidoreductase